MRTPAAVQNLWSRMKRNLTAYDLFALTVVVMIAGHIGYYFMPDENWARVPDRILVPVFLVSIGYNAGRKTTDNLWKYAAFMAALHGFLYHEFFLNIIGTIIIIRPFLDPLVKFLLKSRTMLWSASLVMTAVSPLITPYIEYGTLAVVLAMAGWINKNRSEVPENIVKPYQYFIFAYLSHLYFAQMLYGFTPLLFSLVAIGAGIVFCLLYDFRELLMNSIKRRPKDLIEKICSFIGRKGLEIYVLHVILFQIIVVLALTHVI